MKRFSSIKKNSDFKNIYYTGKSYANIQLVMYVSENFSEDTRIGISVSKKVGNSVVRHHMTRLLIEVFLLNKQKIRRWLDIIVVVRVAAKTSDYKQLEGAFLHLCGLHNIKLESK